MDEVFDLLRSPLHTSIDGWAYIPHLASCMGIKQQHISILFPSRCLTLEPCSMLQNHQTYRRREAYERRGLYLRAAPTGGYLRTERMRARLTTRSRHYDVDDACTDNHPRPTKRMRETTAVDNANGPAAQNTVARQQTQAPTRQSAPCLSHSQDLSDDDVELVTEAEREEAEVRQVCREEVRRVRYPTPRLPLQIPRSFSPDTHRESLSVSPTAA